MIHLVTYSADNMSLSREVCVKAARENGVDNVYSQDPGIISKEFYATNKAILDSPRGIGYWLWKPYLINKTAEICNDGDILIYCDAGVKLINNVSHIIEVMDQDIFMFSNGHQHIHWCKADVLKTILGWGDNYEESTDCGNLFIYDWKPEYSQYQQAQASVIFFKINQNTRKFIKEWLLWCQMPGFIDDSPSKLPNHPEFAQHRYDQAILTCMAIKYGYRLHYWADQRWYWSQRSRWPGDDYPLMFDHHRNANKGMGGGDRPEWE